MSTNTGSAIRVVAYGAGGWDTLSLPIAFVLPAVNDPAVLLPSEGL